MIGNTLVYAELTVGKSDRVDMLDKKVQVYIQYKHEIYEPNWQAAWLFDFLLGWRWPREASCGFTDRAVQRRLWRNFLKI